MIKLKKFLELKIGLEDNPDTKPKLCVYSPIHEYMFYEDELKTESNVDLDFIMNQPIERISFREHFKNYLVLILKDYGKEKNQKIRVKLANKRWRRGS